MRYWIMYSPQDKGTLMRILTETNPVKDADCRTLYFQNREETGYALRLLPLAKEWCYIMCLHMITGAIEFETVPPEGSK
jgi:hypothetical protein